MKRYLLQVVPPGGETKTYDVTCERHEQTNSEGRTFVAFYIGEQRILDAVVGIGHSCVLSCTEAQNAPVA